MSGVMGCLHSKSCIGKAHFSSKDCGIRQRKQAKVARNVSYSPGSSSGEEGEIGDQLHQFSVNRESDLAINRLSRVSSQFLPPDGSRTVKVPSAGYELRYSYLSQRGFYPDALDKANQDSFCIHTPFGTNPDDHFFGVFDGHGEHGAQCSQFVKKKLCENLLRNSQFHLDAFQACHAAYLTTNSQLHADILDDSMSGTTAITVLVRGRMIYVANSGDSRAVIAQRRGKDIVAVDLSIDQTPFRADELERVKLCGARVLTLDQIEGLKNPDVQCWGTEDGDDGDPPRLWVQNGMFPGTAFTRSIGDSIAETIGVVANPEIVVLELTPAHPFFVIASDGVFEFLSSQTVVNMVAKFSDPRDACAAVVAESYRLWLQYETRTDDITVIVVHINGLTVMNPDQAAMDVAIKPIHPMLEPTVSEPPTTSLNSMNHHVRHDLSRARLKVLESSLENDHIWVPSAPSHRKTWEEEAHIERALHDHFLFKKLNDSQCHVLLDCMQRVDVQPGDIVVKQGGEGDCFYVVGSGEFEVLATQEDEKKETSKVLHRYTAEKLSCFGELALMYNKPLQSSVRAVTRGTLWALKREDFRGILMSKFSNLSSLKVLRSVEILSRLTILQLSHIADSLLECSFSDGQTIVDKNECLSALYIIQKGKVRLSYDADTIRNLHASGILPDGLGFLDEKQNICEYSVEKTEGTHFGEWALLGENVGFIRAVAIGNVVCAIIPKEKFDSAVGPIAKCSLNDQRLHCNLPKAPKEIITDIKIENLTKIRLSDLEWRACIYSTDCGEIGNVLLKGFENMLCLKRFSKQRIKQLGKEAQVLKEKDLMKSLNQSICLPKILCTFADQIYAGILLNTCLACPLSSIIQKPLDEMSAKFCTASIVIALEELHQNRVLCRGLSPDVLMLDRSGYIQLIDFRFGKKLDTERTFTICGMADSLAPEIIQGKGHDLLVDWWALGVLIYFMLHAEMPFGSWRESELDTCAKIAKGQLTLPKTFSPDAADLISKLLEVDETARLGSQGPTSVKSHPWFVGIDWKGIRERSLPVPDEITARINQLHGIHAENFLEPLPSNANPVLDTSEWLEDW